MLCSHFEKLGSPQFRRWLANVAVLLPDANLKRLKWVIETMDEAANDIFRIKKAALKTDGSKAFLELEGPDIMDTLCTCSPKIVGKYAYRCHLVCSEEECPVS